MKTNHHYQKQGKINVSSERPMLGLKNLRNSQLGNHPTEHITKGKKKKRRKEKRKKKKESWDCSKYPGWQINHLIVEVKANFLKPLQSL